MIIMKGHRARNEADPFFLSPQAPSLLKGEVIVWLI
jgi:hypothetical protein